MRKVLCGLLLLALGGCARIEAIFTPPPAPPAPSTRSAPVPSTPPSRPPAPPLPVVAPGMSAAEERQLSEDAERRVGEADRLLRRLEARGMRGDEREMLATAQKLLEEARKALAAREYLRAANLATKARALGDDLAPR
ncbi:MAG: hypothetical protein HY216_03930 [Candidatus Rokubacteria bacterium]|nr:hypothetical protein [Candidatus Rokubacteria bacterium]